MKKQNFAPILGAVVAALIAAGCASISRRGTQTIPVTSSPAGAVVSVNGVEQGPAPLVLRLDRAGKGQLIRLESPGYNPVEIRTQRKRSAGPLLGNILLGLLTGFIPAAYYEVFNDDPMDGYSGTSMAIWFASAAAIGGLLTMLDGKKGYEVAPKELTVTMTKADGAPRVDTIFIDANDIHNIKWIRVRRS